GSLVLGVLYQPLLGTDISFLLSSLATAGLLTLGQPLAQLLARGPWERPPLRLLVDGVSATLSATLFCAPLLSCLDGDMSAISVFANLVAGPLGELLALPACLLHTLAAPLPGVE